MKQSKSTYSVRVAQQHNENRNGGPPKLELPHNDEMRCMHGPTDRCETCMMDSIRLIDESPTKTTLLVDDDYDPV